MKKNVIIGIGVFVVILLTSAVSYGVNLMAERMQPKSPSDYHIGVTFDEAMNGEKPVIVLFYVNWCGFCQRFMPKFNTLSKHEMKASTAKLLKQDKKRRRRARYVTRQQADTK